MAHEPGCYPFEGVWPTLGADVYIAPGARVIGNVTLHDGVSIWYNAVLRGDISPIEIGAGTNIQDNTVIHADPNAPAFIGQNVTVGHSVMLHGCRIGDDALIGIGSHVLNRAAIGAGSLVAAGATVLEGSDFGEGVLITGTPAKVKRELNDAERARMASGAPDYRELAARHRASQLA